MGKQYLAPAPIGHVYRGANLAMGPFRSSKAVTGWDASAKPSAIILTIYTDEELKIGDITVGAQWDETDAELFTITGAASDTTALADPNDPSLVGKRFYYELTGKKGNAVWILGGNTLIFDNSQHVYPAGISSALPLPYLQAVMSDATLGGDGTSDNPLHLAAKTLFNANGGNHNIPANVILISPDAYFALVQAQHMSFEAGSEPDTRAAFYVRRAVDDDPARAEIRSDGEIRIKDGNTEDALVGHILSLADRTTGKVVWTKPLFKRDDETQLIEATDNGDYFVMRSPVVTTGGYHALRWHFTGGQNTSSDPVHVITTHYHQDEADHVYGRVALRCRTFPNSEQYAVDETILFNIGGNLSTDSLRMSHGAPNQLEGVAVGFNTSTGLLEIAIEHKVTNQQYVYDIEFVNKGTIEDVTTWTLTSATELPSYTLADDPSAEFTDVTVIGVPYSNTATFQPIASDALAHDLFEIPTDALEAYVLNAGTMYLKRPNGLLGNHNEAPWTLNLTAQNHERGWAAFVGILCQAYPQLDEDEVTERTMALLPPVPVRVADVGAIAFPDGHDPHDPAAALYLPDDYAGDLTEVEEIPAVFDEEGNEVTPVTYSAASWFYAARRRNNRDVALFLTTLWSARTTFKQSASIVGLQPTLAAIRAMPTNNVDNRVARENALLDALTAFCGSVSTPAIAAYVAAQAGGNE